MDPLQTGNEEYTNIFYYQQNIKLEAESELTSPIASTFELLGAQPSQQLFVPTTNLGNAKDTKPNVLQQLLPLSEEINYGYDANAIKMELKVEDDDDQIIPKIEPETISKSDQCKLEFDVKISANTNTVKCFHCSYTTTNKASLIKHLISHANLSVSLMGNNPVFEGSRIDFLPLPNAQNQSSISTISALHQCSQCKYYASTREGLVVHTSVQHGKEKEFLCTVCERLYTTKRGLQRHMDLMHKESDLFYCFQCAFSTKHKRSIEVHIQLHTGRFSFACPICDFKTATSYSLSLHMKVHNQSFKPHACPQCDLRFLKATDLTVHLRRHTGEKPYCCEICGKCFIEAYKLTVHSRIHSTDKPYKCIYCDFRTRSRNSLNDHVKKLHIARTIFSCEECDFCTKSKSSLVVHFRKHTGERPYACDICTFRTFHQATLYNHINWHTRKKVYNCSECNYSTTHPYNHSLHMKRHTGLGSRVCYGCNYTSTHRSNFTHHVNVTCKKVRSKLRKSVQND